MSQVQEPTVNDLTLSAEAPPSVLRDWYELTKPRMNMLVVLTTAIGFYMASWAGIEWTLLLHTVIGTALTAAGAAVLNQYMERDYDKLMARTRNRPLAAGRIALLPALLFGVAASLAGVGYLYLVVNPLTAAVGAATLLSYLLIYTPLKRITTLNTIVGAVPGALPPVMGYVAVQNALAVEALALFGILFFWQLPHFLAIAILYRRDYAAGGYVMLPVVDESLDFTSRQILLWAGALIPVSLLPTVLHMTGAVYFAVATLLGLGFLSFGITVAFTRTRADARKLFFASIIYLPLLLAVLALDKV